MEGLGDENCLWEEFYLGHSLAASNKDTSTYLQWSGRKDSENLSYFARFYYSIAVNDWHEPHA